MHPIRCTLMLLLAGGTSAAPLLLMPLPQKVVVSPGALPIDAGFHIATRGYTDPRLESAIQRLAGRVAKQTGISLQASSGKATLLIECRERGSNYPAIGEDESYQLDVAPAGARLEARTVTGALRGIETFAQLIAPAPKGFEVPFVHIEDQPRFPWRGLMLDVARHWMPVTVVERNIDAMAAVKLNVFHWHLSDDQGFRIESKRYPKLQQYGSDGDFYTQGEVQQVIAYARDRAIRVIPEFDMPGHTTAWFVGYPELASAPGPYIIERKWGVFKPAMDPTREETYTFLDGFVGEMAALFPDPYFHIGGDEVVETQWKRPSIQAFAREHELTGAHELQGYFNRRVAEILRNHGKITIGWDEVLGSRLPSDTIIQSWRGQGSLAEAATQKYRSVLSYGYYLDHLNPASEYYANDPLDNKTSGLTPEQKALVLGGEACMWSEYVSPETVDSRIWPAMAAIAERFWSPREVTETNSMYTRLEAVSRWLQWTGIKQGSNRAILDRLAGEQPSQPLRILADASEALGIDGRRKARQYSSLVPLNRFVDAVAPESETVRRLEREVAALGASELRATFTGWIQNEPAVRSLAGNNRSLAELIPLAQNLAATGRIGLGALDYLQKGETAPASWIAERTQELNRLDHPLAETRLAAIRPVRLLLARVRPQAVANTDVRCGNEPLCNSRATVLNWTSATARPNITLERVLWAPRADEKQ